MQDHINTCTGIHDPAYPSCFKGSTLPIGARFVERCDELSSFDDDGEAARDTGLAGEWVKCPNGGQHFLVQA